MEIKRVHHWGVGLGMAILFVLFLIAYPYSGFTHKSPDTWANPAGLEYWAQKAKLYASDGTWDDGLGYAIAISGDTVVVGTWNAEVVENDGQGAAYVFRKPSTGWSGTITESAKLISSDGEAYDYFGQSVAIQGDTIVVGAYAHNTGDYADGGKVYVFTRPTGGWSGTITETAQLTYSNIGWGDYLGWSVAIEGDTIVAGAPA